MEIGISYVDGDSPGFWWRLWRIPGFSSVAPPCASSAWTNRWLDVALLSPSAPGTAICRTQERTRWELFLWLPWTAGHPGPAGDPGGCSWCGMWCNDGWAEVDEEIRDPPTRQCGQSLPGYPTCKPSAVAGWGSWSSSPNLPALDWNGMVTGSLAGIGTKGLVFWMVVAAFGEPNHSKTESLASLVLGLLYESHRWPGHMTGLPDGSNLLLKYFGFHTQDVGPLKGSSPNHAQNLRLEVKIL